MKAFLRKMVERYPDQSVRIIDMARENGDFRSVCEEINIAEQAFQRWRDDPRRAAEYRDLLNELTAEFLTLLGTDERHI